MAFDNSNIEAVTVSGEAFYAPLGTALPTTPTAALNAAFKPTGIIADGGVVERYGDSEGEKIRDMAGVVRRELPSQDAEASLEFAFLETSLNVIEAWYGGTVTQTSTYGSYAADPAASQGRRAWVLHLPDGDETTRWVCADAELKKNGDVTYSAGEAVTYPSRLVCYAAPTKLSTRLKSDA